MGPKSRPIMKNVGRTVLGVRMGCHALSRCCLNAVSVVVVVVGQYQTAQNKMRHVLAGLLQPPFSFLFSGVLPSSPESSRRGLRLKRPIVVGVPVDV